MTTEPISIAAVLQLCLDNRLNFASYREPGGQITTVIQRSKELFEPNIEDDFTNTPGFLISPYRQGRNKTIHIQPDVVIRGEKISKKTFAETATISATTDTLEEKPDIHASSHREYLSQVDQILNAINEGSVKKVVLSRMQTIGGQHRNKAGTMFVQMCKQYPHSFIYMFQADQHLWIGATPEILASVKDGTFTTISLAGTRPDLPENRDVGNWNTKEQQEQQYVTDYIASLLQKYDIPSVKQGAVYPRQAGNLLHLCSEFTCKADAIYKKLPFFLCDLHPTPAVCGIPKNEVMNFLMQLEKHDREYYSGFLGPVHIDANHISLYVNLRCMRICDDHARLYVGGGITRDSYPEAEWSETVLKSETLLSVLNGELVSPHD